MKPVFLDAKKNYTKNITLLNLEEIKAFAEAEEFTEYHCENMPPCGADCECCIIAHVATYFLLINNFDHIFT